MTPEEKIAEAIKLLTEVQEEMRAGNLPDSGSVTEDDSGGGTPPPGPGQPGKP